MGEIGRSEHISIWRSSRLGAAVVWADRILAGQPEHFHSDLLLAQLLRGRVDFTVDGRRIELQPNDVMVVTPGTVHAIDLHPGEPVAARCLYIAPDRLDDALDASIGLRNGVAAGSEVSARLHALHSAVAVGATALEFEEHVLGAVSVLNPDDGADRMRDRRPAVRQRSIVAARDHIDAHPAKPLTLEVLATIAGLSKFHFLRAFKARFGLTPHRYQIQRRLALAKRLIYEGMKPSVAALTAGFVDQAHMNRQFRRFFLETPGQIARSTPM